MNKSELLQDFKEQFGRRKFVGGLLVAFIDMLDDLAVDDTGITDFEGFLSVFPRQTTTSAGKTANTLIVQIDDGTKSLRPYYNAAEALFRAEHKRFDYPSCAPHATQAWNDYLPWLDSLIAMGLDERAELRQLLIEFVLDALPSHEFDPLSVELDAPLFRLVLESFDMAARKGEKTGATFQGIVFGFIRADNPHLQVEIDKVRTGSKRLGRVGDVDAWEGGRLAISAEVKQYALGEDHLDQLAGFSNEATKRGAIAIIAAIDFADGAREALLAQGAEPLSQDDMIRIVTLWDPVKQRTAVSSFLYYVKQIDKNGPLTTRLEQFLDTAEADWHAQRNAAVATS